jgi:hypothetical protein
MHRRVPVVFAFLALCALAGCATKTVNPSAPPPVTPPGPRVNQPPDSWFAGSDPDDPAAGWQVDTGLHAGRYIDLGLTGWGAFRGIPNSLLGPDSLLVLPANRPARKTFYEIFGDRLWIRQEGDTVHLNSYVVFPGGGFDQDSPYAVNVNTALLPDTLRGKPVLTRGPANGSPVGFRVRVQTKDATGTITQPSETTTFPVFDPASVFHYPIISGYWALTSVGKAYAVLRAVDGDGAVDRSVDQQLGGAVGVADRVDAGRGSAEDIALRAKVLTFYVNHPPVLLRDSPAFRPLPNQAFSTRFIHLDPVATDDDWLDPTIINPAGGPPANYGAILRWKVAVLGKLAGTNQDTCYVEPSEFTSPNTVQLTIPPWIAAGSITLRIRVCDCLQCDVTPGSRTCPFAGRESSPQQGNCTDTDIPCQLTAPGPGALGFNQR